MAKKSPRTSAKRVSLAIGRALEAVYAQTSTVEFDQLAELYREVERSSLAQVAGNESLELETKRRVAELMLHSAIEKQCGFEQCQALFDALADLGFTNLERRVTMCVAFARYVASLGMREQSIRLLEPLRDELDDDVHSGKFRGHRELRELVHETLEQLG